MPAERLSMRHLRELLRLRHSAGLSQYVIARSLGLAQGTVSKYLWRARQAEVNAQRRGCAARSRGRWGRGAPRPRRRSSPR